MKKQEINNFIIDDKYHLLKEEEETYISYQLLRFRLYIIKVLNIK